MFCILERGTNGDVFIRQALLSMTREREYAIVVNKKENSLEQNETCRTSTGRKTDLERAVSTNGSCASIIHCKYVHV